MTNLTKWNPVEELEDLLDSDSQLLSLLRRNANLPSILKNYSEFPVDMYEERGNFVVKMNLPGMDAEKININLEGNRLSILGNTKEETETKERNYHSRQIRQGYFQRSLTLPANVQQDPNKVNANYKDGVLTIELPKQEPSATSNKIKINKG